MTKRVSVPDKSYVLLVCGWHKHKVPLCPISGHTDSYVDLRGLSGRKTVTMAAEISYASSIHQSNTHEVSSPPSVMPRLIYSQKERNLTGQEWSSLFLTTRRKPPAPHLFYSTVAFTLPWQQFNTLPSPWSPTDATIALVDCWIIIGRNQSLNGCLWKQLCPNSIVTPVVLHHQSTELSCGDPSITYQLSKCDIGEKLRSYGFPPFHHEGHTLSLQGVARIKLPVLMKG